MITIIIYQPNLLALTTSQATWLNITKTGKSLILVHICDISQSIENIMDGKYYQRGNIEKDRNRPRNSATIQDEEITISRTSYKT